MKIMFAIKSMQTKGGAEKVLALVASGLARRGHTVLLLSFDAPSSTPAYPLSKDVRQLHMGIGVAQQRTGVGAALRRIAAMRHTAKQTRPDVVVSFMYSSYVPAALALVGTGIPLIGSEHIVPAYYRDRPLHFALLLASTLFMRRLTVVAESIIGLFPQWVQSKLVYAPNPVVLPAPSSVNKPAHKTLLTVGRMTAQKNQRVLIDAFAALASAFPDWHLRIVGDGELRPQLSAQIAASGLSDRITLAPFTDQIENEYAVADLFVIPSRFESFGLVTAEANMAGLPAVGFANCPGTNEIIKNGYNGLLAAGNDNAATLAAALRQLMADDDLRSRYAHNARASSQQYQLEPVLDAWEKIITQDTR